VRRVRNNREKAVDGGGSQGAGGRRAPKADEKEDEYGMAKNINDWGQGVWVDGGGQEMKIKEVCRGEWIVWPTEK